jgi:hypothetical protein
VQPCKTRRVAATFLRERNNWRERSRIEGRAN